MSWLETKYIHLIGGHLDRFKEKKMDLWEFRCPVCGDSARDRTKTRGYIYVYDGDYRFKCHKCGASEYFSWLLEYMSPELHKEYKIEWFKENRGSAPKREKPKPKAKFKRRARSSTPTEVIAPPSKLEDLERVSDLPSEHKIVQYVAGRLIPENRWNELYWVPNMREAADIVGGYDDTHFDHHPRLLLPFINRDNVLTHIQGRAVGNNVDKASRFYTLEVEEDHPKVFGMNMLTDTLPVQVVEGPIDSFFLTNCVGMGGSDVPWHLFDPNNTTFVWDNEPRAPQIIKRMKQAVRLGFKICVWGRNISQKDINDMVKAGRNIEWLDSYILNHSFSGLKANMAITQYEKRKDSRKRNR